MKKLNTIALKKIENKLPIWSAVFVILILLGFLWIVVAVDKLLPTPLYLQDEESNPHSFIAEKAYDYLQPLVAIGPRVVGTIQNEVLAVEYLKSQLNEIKSTCKLNMEDIDVQTIQGYYYLDYKPYGTLNQYSNLQNIVVRIRGNRRSAVLVNSHFDTMPESPGGSDAGIMVAIMMETIRKLCQQSVSFENDLVFLFNGAEESYLHGSHGYITSPEGKNDNVKILINLEATGAGGKEMLFQTGPNQDWLINYYKNVPHPHAHAAGEEMFQKNLIPSDTDFRIFRDFGDLKGFDLAYTRNGYRYHTKYDGIKNLELGTFQHTGDNVLSLVRDLANADEVANIPEESAKPTYYDFLGLFLIEYDKTGELVLNHFAILISFGVTLKCFFDIRSENNLLDGDLEAEHEKYGFKHVAVITASIIGGWLIAVLLAVAIGGILDGFNSTMSWYKNMYMILGLYASVTLFGVVLAVMLMEHFTSFGSVHKKMQISLHIGRIIMTVILIIGVSMSIRSVYMFVMPILFSSSAFLFIQLFNLQYSKYKWIVVYLISTIMPTLFTYYFALELLSLLIPITGRMGGNFNPELMIGLITVLMTLLILIYYAPLLSCVNDLKYLLGILAVIILTFFILAVTSFGFPYQASGSDPRPQRYWLYHTQREFQNDSGVYTDLGYVFENMDRNSPRALEDDVNALSTRIGLQKMCNDYLYCALPVMYAAEIDDLKEYVWLPSEQQPVMDPVDLTLHNIEHMADYSAYTFVAKGNNHFNVYISEMEGSVITAIKPFESLPSESPLFHGRPVYFLLFVDGSHNNDYHEFEFTVNVQHLQIEPDMKRIQIAIAGTYYDSKSNHKTTEYEALLKQFPDWAAVSPWLGSYKSYEF